MPRAVRRSLGAAAPVAESVIPISRAQSPCAGATARAQQLLGRVQRALGDGAALAFLISGGCCGGTNPVLCRRDAVLDGFDVALGAAGGVPVFAHPDHARYLDHDHFLIDALDDPRSDTFSLEAPHGGRFVLRELSSAHGPAE